MSWERGVIDDIPGKAMTPEQYRAWVDRHGRPPCWPPQHQRSRRPTTDDYDPGGDDDRDPSVGDPDDWGELGVELDCLDGALT